MTCVLSTALSCGQKSENRPTASSAAGGGGGGSGGSPDGTTTRTNGTSGGGNCLFIVNGKTDSHNFRSVGLLFGSNYGCSGTFISANTMLTAAHCVDNSTTGGVRFIYGNQVASGQEADAYDIGIEPLKVFHHAGVYGENVDVNSAAGRQKDLAILIFPDGTAPDVTELSSIRPSEGDEATIVGYGLTDLPEYFTGTHTFKRRYGKNSITLDPTDPALFLVGAVKTNNTTGNATDSSTSQGDSGGPIIVDGNIVGVTSAGALSADGSEGYSAFVDLSYSYSTTLLTEAKNGGADIYNDGSGGTPNTLYPDQDIKAVEDCQ